MAKRYSIAEIRNRLSEVVHEAEEGEEITLTRRGKPVAVLLSRQKFTRLRGKIGRVLECLPRVPKNGGAQTSWNQSQRLCGVT